MAASSRPQRNQEIVGAVLARAFDVEFMQDEGDALEELCRSTSEQSAAIILAAQEHKILSALLLGSEQDGIMG